MITKIIVAILAIIGLCNSKAADLQLAAITDNGAEFRVDQERVVPVKGRLYSMVYMKSAAANSVSSVNFPISACGGGSTTINVEDDAGKRVYNARVGDNSVPGQVSAMVCSIYIYQGKLK